MKEMQAEPIQQIKETCKIMGVFSLKKRSITLEIPEFILNIKK